MNTEFHYHKPSPKHWPSCAPIAAGPEPYDAAEFIATLIRREKQRADEEKKHLGQCDFCGEPLPMGCKNGLGIPKLKASEAAFTHEKKEN